MRNNNEDSAQEITEMERIITVKEAKKQCYIEGYDPHSNAGYVIIDDNDHVVNNFHGHPIVYKNQCDAQDAINEHNP